MVEKAVPAYSVVGVGRLSARVALRPRIFAILVGASIRMGVVLVAFAGFGLCINWAEIVGCCARDYSCAFRFI
jgi:hypothetical protein